MFKFLKIRTSDSGDARRHVPFASIIHKHVLPLFVSLLFCFVMVVPVKVLALADPVPQFDVINGTDIDTFIGGYNAASSDIQWITNSLIGAQVLEYGGLGSYSVRFSQLPADADVWDRLVLIGEKVTDDLMAPYVAADRYFSKIIDFAQGALNFARGFASKTAFLSHVNDVQNFYLEYTPELGSEFNQFFAVHDGLYSWQFSEASWEGNFSWRYNDLTGSIANSYNNYLANLAMPRSFANYQNANLYNIVFNVPADLADGIDIFIDTVNHIVKVINFPNLISNIPVIGAYSSNAFSFTNYYMINVNQPYSPGNYATYVDLVNHFLRSYNSNSLLRIEQNGNNQYYFNVAAFVNQVRAGASWSEGTVITNQSDLGIIDTDSLQVLNPEPGKKLTFDLKDMVEEIVAGDPEPALEVPLRPIIYNITQVNGDPLTAQDLEGLSFNVKPTQSGIDFSPDVFLPMFNGGSGFISYMWYMTKPLVMFTRDLLDSLTFDPVNGFSASGPGYFILGVAGLGVIGGVIVKFLL